MAKRKQRNSESDDRIEQIVDAEESSSEVVSEVQSQIQVSSLPVNEFEKYEIVTIKRSECSNAPYNPRLITDKSRKKLVESIKRSGLLGPIHWNKRTGNIFGGNQRLKVLDALSGGNDYSLRVAKVDIPLNEEKQLAVFLNNEYAQGGWDYDLLTKILSEDDFDTYAAGFDGSEIRQLLGGDPVGQDADQLLEMAEAEKGALDQYKNVATSKETSIGLLRQQVDFYTVVVFRSDADRASFHTMVGEGDGKCVDGRVLTNYLKNLGIYRGKLKESEWIVADIECPRCGLIHHVSLFDLKTDNQTSGNTHWTWCPTLCQPVLVNVSESKENGDIEISPK